MRRCDNPSHQNLKACVIMSEKILILVADDEQNLLLLLKDNLEEYGFEVVTATNGQEALDKAQTITPSVIILDVEMPKLNGWQVCEKLRNDGRLKDVPVLILSAYTQPEDIKKGLALGAKKYLTKPFKMKDLIDVLLDLKKP